MAGPHAQLPAVHSNSNWLGYRCVVCGHEYARSHRGFVCDDCGIDGILDVVYDLRSVARGLSGGMPFGHDGVGGLWRFAALLPITPETAHSAWTCGATPVHRADRLADHLGLDSLVLKDDTGLPSASLKDRAAAVAIAHASQLGINHLACASTGNAAASLAVLSARAGMACTIFVPADAPRAKLAQLLLHGARVIPVTGSYDQAFDLSLREIANHKWYSRNCAHNPLLVEGKKTATLELVADLTAQFSGSNDALPHAVFVPVGDGCIVSSVAKAFRELEKVGLINRVPRVYGVQADGAAPLARAWNSAGRNAADMKGPEILTAIEPVTASTVADSISVGVPRNRVKAWRGVARTGGGFVAVPDEAIIEAIGLLAARAGVFAEPSGAAGLAGVVAALEKGWITARDRVAVLVTGNGLKDPEVALAGIKIPPGVDPIDPAENPR